MNANAGNALARVEAAIDKSVTKAMAVGGRGVSFANAGEVMEYAKMMAASGSAVPKHLRGQPGACLGILDDAIRFEMSPYALARKSYFVNDNLAYESQVLAAIVLARAPLKKRPDVTFTGEGDKRKCKVIYTLIDGDVKEYESPPFGQIQPKNSPLWKSDPDQQQSYYSLRAGARRIFQDVLLGIYDQEEMAAMSAQDITPPKHGDDLLKRLGERKETPDQGFDRAKDTIEHEAATAAQDQDEFGEEAEQTSADADAPEDDGLPSEEASGATNFGNDDQDEDLFPGDVESEEVADVETETPVEAFINDLGVCKSKEDVFALTDKYAGAINALSEDEMGRANRARAARLKEIAGGKK